MNWRTTLSQNTSRTLLLNLFSCTITYFPKVVWRNFLLKSAKVYIYLSGLSIYMLPEMDDYTSWLRFHFTMLLIFTILLLLLYLAKRISWWVRWVLLQQETALVNLVLLLLLLLACKYFILNFLIRIWHHACVNAKHGVLLMKLFALIIILIIDLPHLYICTSLKWSMQGYFNYKNAITLWECNSPKYVNMRTVCFEYFICLINQFTRA